MSSFDRFENIIMFFFKNIIRSLETRKKVLMYIRSEEKVLQSFTFLNLYGKFLLKGRIKGSTLKLKLIFKIFILIISIKGYIQFSLIGLLRSFFFLNNSSESLFNIILSRLLNLIAIQYLAKVLNFQIFQKTLHIIVENDFDFL